MIFLSGTALFVVAVIFEGFVLSILWKWFVVPVFGAPVLTITYAIGLALIVGMLTAKARKQEHAPELVEVLSQGLVTPLVFLVIGWIVKAFV